MTTDGTANIILAIRLHRDRQPHPRIYIYRAFNLLKFAINPEDFDTSVRRCKFQNFRMLLALGTLYPLLPAATADINNS